MVGTFDEDNYRPTLGYTISLLQQWMTEQRWYSREPYWNHCLRVADTVRLVTDDKDVIQAALLHDLVEDTEWTIDQLRALGYAERTLELVGKLTHDRSVSYPDYITSLLDDPDAITIKKADISDNLSTCPTGAKMAAKYVEALAIIHGKQLPIDVERALR